MRRLWSPSQPWGLEEAHDHTLCAGLHLVTPSPCATLELDELLGKLEEVSTLFLF